MMFRCSWEHRVDFGNRGVRLEWSRSAERCLLDLLLLKQLVVFD